MTQVLTDSINAVNLNILNNETEQDEMNSKARMIRTMKIELARLYTYGASKAKIAKIERELNRIELNRC